MTQAKSIDSEILRRMNYRHGEISYFANDMYIGRALELYGEWSEGEVDLFRQILRPGDHVVEAGSNIGAHTIALAKMGVNVLGIEGQPVVKALLDHNLAANGITTVRTELAMVSCAPGEIHLPLPDYAEAVNVGGVSAHAATRVLSEMGEAVGVDKLPAVTLDELALARVDLIKADIEGFEIPFLMGAEGTISRTRPLLYLEANPGPTRPALIALTRALDYRVYAHEVQMFNPDNFLGNPENVFVNLVSHNILCVPKERPEEFTGLLELA
ncbi:FkbM family methyltransferase [Williamsia sp. CHRR-6]|uniref:FkbM family methyltransferase n=1 Tax=Williamsia sp. CHRR-6 TaxID=2835871 RepID=UPI001BD92935|nr:FkbM family methyltransferase [Williamsia sp. CHRR-6]MBT0568307.1 FkbM family methyltransferase [Williamsia sp. CHRR-6]